MTHIMGGQLVSAPLTDDQSWHMRCAIVPECGERAGRSVPSRVQLAKASRREVAERRTGVQAYCSLQSPHPSSMTGRVDGIRQGIMLPDSTCSPGRICWRDRRFRSTSVVNVVSANVLVLEPKSCSPALPLRCGLAKPSVLHSHRGGSTKLSARSPRRR